MKVLSCPKCEGELQSVVYDDIEIDRCCQCSGIWFDSSEAEQLKQLKGSESIDVGQLNLENQKQSLEENVYCPRCQVPMIKILDFDKYPIWYETCPQCQGIWFDSGEFKKFKDNFSQHLLSRAFNLFRFKKP